MTQQVQEEYDVSMSNANTALRNKDQDISRLMETITALSNSVRVTAFIGCGCLLVIYVCICMYLCMYLFLVKKFCLFAVILILTYCFSQYHWISMVFVF
jgi:hypothetical protein